MEKLRQELHELGVEAQVVADFDTPKMKADRESRVSEILAIMNGEEWNF